jgi:integrase
MKTNFIPRIYKRKFAPLYLHITGFSKRERLLLDVEIEHVYWSSEKQRIDITKVLDADKKRRYQDINLIIDNIDSKLTNIKTVYRLSEIVLTPLKLKQELINDLPRVNFCSFFQHAIDEEKKLLEIGTYKKLQSVLNKLKRYNDQIIFTDLTENWFEKYRIYLSQIGNQKTTIASNIKSIKKIIRKAQKVGIKVPCNLDEIKAGSTAGTKIALQIFELQKIKKYFDSEFINETHRLMLGYFLFSCVTGLRYFDVMNLEREAVLGDYIQFKAEKVDKVQTITLNKRAKELVDLEPRLFVKKLTNQYINRELKVIMKNLSIKKKVTFHVSRHTFATSYLRLGGKLEKLRLLLGHSSLQQSEVYNHIVAAEANKEIFLLDSLF